MADFIVGSPVRDDDFWFRKDYVEDIWEVLEKHNVLLLAPRRIGKTSVMYQMLDHPKEGWIVIHLNVEDLESPDDFFISLIDAINEHQPEYVISTYKNITIKQRLFLKCFSKRFISLNHILIFPKFY